MRVLEIGWQVFNIGVLVAIVYGLVRLGKKISFISKRLSHLEENTSKIKQDIDGDEK